MINRSLSFVNTRNKIVGKYDLELMHQECTFTHVVSGGVKLLAPFDASDMSRVGLYGYTAYDSCRGPNSANQMNRKMGCFTRGGFLKKEEVYYMYFFSYDRMIHIIQMI